MAMASAFEGSNGKINWDTRAVRESNPKPKKSKDEAKRILKKGADVSNFGDPIEWQKKDRTDRKINGQKLGLQEFSYGENKVWALNKTNADKKAKKLGWI